MTLKQFLAALTEFVTEQTSVGPHDPQSYDLAESDKEDIAGGIQQFVDDYFDEESDEDEPEEDGDDKADGE
jgi:hypothetical protein